MQIYVKNLLGKYLTLDVSHTDTVTAIKSRLESSESVPVRQQRLIYAGRQLEDDRTLADYHIMNKSTLHLVLRLGCGAGGAEGERDSPATMDIYVKNLIGRTVRLIVFPTDTITAIKSRLESLESVPVRKQCLIFAGRQLENDHTLADYNITNKSTLHPVFRLGGETCFSMRPHGVSMMTMHIFVKQLDGKTWKSYNY
ncbi:hypothetical protein Droror1_Dr00001079 [Drosera rotundifolia]